MATKAKQGTNNTKKSSSQKNSGKSSGQSSGQSRAKKVQEFVSEARDKAQDIVEEIKQDFQEVKENLEENIKETKENIKEKIEEIKEEIQDELKEKVQEDTEDAIQEAKHEFVDEIPEKVIEIKEEIEEESQEVFFAGESAEEKQDNGEAVIEPELLLNDHAEEVRSMFSTITKRYDLLNHVCSLGLDFWWRKVLVEGFILGSKKKILDMAAGTLDVSLSALRKHGNTFVVAGDICAEMLEYGKNKIKYNEKDRIRLQVMNTLAIPYGDKEFDIVSMAFGIRNVDDRTRALSEMNRVLEVGGQLHILEFSPVKNPYLQKAYYFYIQKVMPAIAKLLGENAKAYEYLAQSIKDFPSQEDFCGEIRNAGFEFVTYKKLTLGIVTIYTAIKTKQ